MSATARPFAHTFDAIAALAADPPARLSDGQLLDRFSRERDEAAFAELVRRHGPLVLGATHTLLDQR